MKNRLLATFVIGLLLLAPASSKANISVAREVESQKVHFDSSGYTLSSDSKLILDQAISLLSMMNDSYSLKIVGFTDDKGTEDLNHDLSVQRANAVASYLIARGIDRNRILIQGLGRESPVASNDTDDGRMRNRRVEFKFLSPDTSNLKLTASTDVLPILPKEPEMLEISPAPQAEVVPAEVVAPKEEPKVVSEEPKKVEAVESSSPSIRKTKSEHEKDTMLSPVKKQRNTYISKHIYEDRKRGEAGQSYVQITPLLMTVDGMQTLGAPEDRLSSRVSFRGEAGWISFLDDYYESFVIAKGYGSVLRFDQEAANLIDDKQKEFTYGGELGVGRYFHPNVSLQISAGYGTEFIYRPLGGNIELDNEFIGHAGLTVEAVVWRFSERGDIGLDGSFMYYDFGRGILKTGSGYNLNVFMDYDFLRVAVGFTMNSFETTNFDYSSWYFGPNIRLYF
jgi:hypothetical protein